MGSGYKCSNPRTELPQLRAHVVMLGAAAQAFQAGQSCPDRFARVCLNPWPQ